MTRHGGRALALLVGIGAALAGGPAFANGIAGDRLFPSTLTVEDTQNDDEVSLPMVFGLRRGANGDNMLAGRDLDITGEFSRSLTADLSALVGTGWRRRNLGGGTRTGWDNLDLGLKYVTLLDAPHELSVSTALIYEIGDTGARGVGAGVHRPAGSQLRQRVWRPAARDGLAASGGGHRRRRARRADRIGAEDGPLRPDPAI